MATQTVTVTKPGTTWDSLAVAMTDFQEFTDNAMVDAILGYKLDGLMTSTTDLSEDGTSITFTREWDDAAFAEFTSLQADAISAHRAALEAAGWTIDASA